ncbi:hypothetical protein [Sporosarcina globispora]|nr:hypothetical protein [Sporosarcina globispora]
MKMNEDKLRILVDYLSTLSRLEGNYHKEIAAAIFSIESELGIKKG